MARILFIAALWALVAADFASTVASVPALNVLRLLSLPAAVSGTIYLVLRRRRRLLGVDNT